MFRSKGASGKIDEDAGEWPRGTADLLRRRGIGRFVAAPGFRFTPSNILVGFWR